ncbi:MAG: protein kinase domain-containing protein [Planctomycetota bacterium]|jgi:non-specific serine/threonine protein kinase/serine/threonine-protein kinase
MDTKRLNIKKIFCAALEKKTPTERKAYLDQACGDDSGLRGDVEALLSAYYASDNSFLESPPVGISGKPDDWALSEGPGTIIGRYKLLQLIGEGGFGVVYMAEQQKPIRRRVALKIIKLGMDTKQVIARFEAERQALAMMEHPNIAKVLDAGATDTGRPYFVMELVKGIPVTEYCDKNNLDTRQRLELFIDVCKAVQHAHQKGIIHRDIKPTNVMITLHDGKPVPKVIDFGIAKATQHRLTEKTLFTEYQQFIGTPEYMSPEQAEMSGLDVDTRSDIYSLGVLLYQLLTGTTPFDADKLRSAAYDEIRRIIRETEPATPSRRLSTLGDTLTDIAKRRHTEPAALRKLVRGDLDWIVMKTLEKDRTRRYETANELVLDIERHLADEPVMAGPPGAVYRLRKFVKRHRTGVIFCLSVAAALVIGLSVATVGFVQASRERNRSEKNFQKAREAVDKMTEVAQHQLANVPRMEQTRQDLLQQAQVFYQEFLEGNKGDLEVREETGRAYRRLGDIHNTLGQYEQAEQAYLNAIDIFERLADEFPDMAEYQMEVGVGNNGLGVALRVLGRHPEAEEAHRAAVALLEPLAEEFPTEPDYLKAFAEAYNNLGLVLTDTGQLEEAEQACRKALEIREKLAGEFPAVPEYGHALATSYYSLGLVLDEYAARGDMDWSQWFERAEPVYREALQFQEGLAADFPGVAEYRHQLARICLSLGKLLWRTVRYQEAERFLQKALTVEKKLVEEFPTVAKYRLVLAESHHHLSLLLPTSGRRQEAVEARRRALAHFKKLVDDSPRVHCYHATLAELIYQTWLTERSYVHHMQTYDYDMLTQAIAHLEKAVKLSPEQASYRQMFANRSRILAHVLTWPEVRRQEEAEQVLARAIGLFESLLGDVPACRLELVGLFADLGALFQEQGRAAEAQAAYRQAETFREEMMTQFPKLSCEYRKASFPWHMKVAGAAFVDYKVRITTVGEYQLYVRYDGHDSASDSFYVWVEQLSDGPRGDVADWYRYCSWTDADFSTHPWQGAAGFERMDRAGHDAGAVLPIPNPGEYTIRFASREDGAAIDAFVLQLSDLPAPAGYGPEESEMTGEMIFLESGGQVVVEAEHFASRTPLSRNWLVVPDEDPGDIAHLHFRGTGYVQVLPDATAPLKEWMILRNRGEVQATLGQWDRAVSHFGDAIAQGADWPSVWRSQALAYLAAGDIEGYRRTCESVLENFGQTERPFRAFLTAWTCVLAPDAVEDPGRIVQLAKRAVENDSEREGYLNALGASLYRAGRFDEAIQQLRSLVAGWEKAGKMPTGYSPAFTWFFLAMAHHQLGNSAEARACLDKAVARAEQESSGELRWHQRLALQLLRQEAESLIKGPAQEQTSGKEVVAEKTDDRGQKTEDSKE